MDGTGIANGGEAQIDTGDVSVVRERRSFCFVSNRSTATTGDVVARERSPRWHLRNRRHQKGPERAAIGKIEQGTPERDFNLPGVEQQHGRPHIQLCHA